MLRSRPQLPWCANSPSVSQPLMMLRQSSQRTAQLSDAVGGAPCARLVDRMLVWLLTRAAVDDLSSQRSASAAFEAQPLAAEFLAGARRWEASISLAGTDVQQGGWETGPVADAARLRWALAEAKTLLQRYAGLCGLVEERMAVGTSFGSCVLLIESQLAGGVRQRRRAARPALGVQPGLTEAPPLQRMDDGGNEGRPAARRPKNTRRRVI